MDDTRNEFSGICRVTSIAKIITNFKSQKGVYMNTIFWKSIVSSFFLVVFCLQNSFADDVRLKIPVSSINNLFSAITESKYLSYGTFDNGGYVTYYSIKLQSATMNVSAGNTFSLTLVVDAMADFNVASFDFGARLTGQSITVTGPINLQPQGTGYKITFTPTNITYNTDNWLKNVINAAISGMINKLPEISTSSNQPLLPSIAASYFTSGTPTLTTTTTDIILGLTLAAGPKFITVQNEVNQRVDLGNVQEVVSNVVIGTYGSNKTFDWYTNDIKQVQTPDERITSTNGQNKYKSWFKGTNPTPEPDVALRRIQLTVGTTDATYSAKFPQAQRLQLSNVLEGSFGGGTVSYQNSVGQSANGASIDDYDYKDGIGIGNTTVPDGTLSNNWYFSGWSDGNTSQTRNIVVNADQNIVANYKAISASSTTSGLGSGSQRKIVRTNDSRLVMVYESAGAVWLQHSSDEGVTWFQIEKVADNAKQPSLALWGNDVVIAYQKNNSGNYQIASKIFSGSLHMLRGEMVISASTPYSDNAQVVAGISPDGHIFYVWRQTTASGNAGLFYNGGVIIDTIFTSQLSGKLGTTSASSSSPSIGSPLVIESGLNWYHFPLVWTEGTQVNLSDIQYRLNSGWQNMGSNGTPISSTDGFTSNYNPSIVAIGATGARVCWVGYRNNGGGGGLEKNQAVDGPQYKTIFTDPGTPGVFWSFGSEVNSATINKNTQLNNNVDVSYIIAWSANNGTTTKYTRSSSLGTSIRDFKTGTTLINGKDVQVSNGTSFSDMYGVMLNGQPSAPYKIHLSSNIDALGKEQSLTSFNGREGVLSDTITNAQFYFTIGDIFVDGNEVDFIEKHDSIKITSVDLLNSYLVSKPFTLNENSTFLYGVQYGFTDSSAAAELLTDEKAMNFKVQLVDVQSGQVIGEYDNITYNQQNLYQYTNIGYQVDTKGIVGSKTVVLRLVCSSNAATKYALNNHYSTESVIGLGKNGERRKQVSYQGTLAVTSYALEQNYPNPFNPSTTINYQLPKDGLVTMKVYDILGKEVATLVNAHKQIGRYSVVYDASLLSSGTYIVRLRSDDYVKTMKIVLMK